MNNKYGSIEDFKGYVLQVTKPNRKFLLFISLILIIAAIFIGVSSQRYDLNRYELPQDFRGDYCGIKQLQKEKYLYWPDPIKWGFAVKACLEKCPEKDGIELCLYKTVYEAYYEE